MISPFGIVAIVGVGLLGGSLGLGLKQRGLAGTVLGVGRRQGSLDAALEAGALDRGFLEPESACSQADLIVLCVPAGSAPALLDRIKPVVRPGAILTDVISTKASLCAHIRQSWPPPYRVVPSHPMAGSEKYGPEHAIPNLYQGCWTIMTPLEDQDQEAYERIKGLWEALGAKVAEMEPEAHDALVARTSHVPHIVAGCLAELAAAAGECAGPAVGQGFRDATRIAAGRPEIWRDICLTNAAAVAEGLEAMQQYLAHVQSLVRSGSGEDLAQFFASAQAARERVVKDPDR